MIIVLVPTQAIQDVTMKKYDLLCWCCRSLPILLLFLLYQFYIIQWIQCMCTVCSFRSTNSVSCNVRIIWLIFHDVQFCLTIFITCCMYIFDAFGYTTSLFPSFCLNGHYSRLVLAWNLPLLHCITRDSVTDCLYSKYNEHNPLGILRSTSRSVRRRFSLPPVRTRYSWC